MRFLSPTVDPVFKRLFGNKLHTELTRSFLNAVLERKSGALITKVAIDDTANLLVAPEDKKSFVDLRCTDEKGNQYIVEMQVSKQPYFLKRATYYAAFGVVDQINRLKDYDLLKPVIFIAIVDFELFEDKKLSKALTHHLITEVETQKQTMPDLEFHYIELKKFNKTLEELETETDKWIYLIKKADELNAIPREFEGSETFKNAFEILNESSWSHDERLLYTKLLDLRWQERIKLKTEREEGKLEGKLEGIQENKLKVAKSLLLANVDLKIIAEATGLDPEVIKKLKK